MTNSQSKIPDFVALPRYLTNHYIKRVLTKPEYEVLIWIWNNTNPYNGLFNTSYGSLIADLHFGIEESSMRKIVSSLRKKQYIHFKDHKGRAGSFPIYPVNFRRTDGLIQTKEFFQRQKEIQTQPQPKLILNDKSGSNSDTQSHNLNTAISGLSNHFSTRSQFGKAATPYNYNKKDNKLMPSSSGSDGAHKEYRGRDITKTIPPDTFTPKDNEEELCWIITQNLAGTDMRPLIIPLEKYKFAFIEQTWDEFQKLPRDKDKNPADQFNNFINDKAKQAGIY